MTRLLGAGWVDRKILRQSEEDVSKEKASTQPGYVTVIGGQPRQNKQSNGKKTRTGP